MYIKDINIVNFRNYDKLLLKFEKGINIIYGNNGQGKTNLLESLYFLALTKSHRSYIDNNLIKQNEEYSKIVGNIYIHNIKSKLEINISNKNKILKVDNNIIKKTSDYISKMNIIIFYPDDLELIKGSPSVRRRFLNLELSQLHSDYYILINDYNKILKMRNDYLKKSKNFDNNYFNIITNYLIDKSINIYILRNKFINKLNENASKIYKDLTLIDSFNILYKTSINFEIFEKDYLKEKLKHEFKNIYNKELKYKTTLIGPHRDDLEFYIDNLEIKNYGSQGQQRSSVLAIKLSEIEIFKKYTGSYPILLLDDVFSELDKIKKNNLLKYINKNIQVLITTTDLTNLSRKLIKSSKLIQIDNGNIKKIVEVS